MIPVKNVITEENHLPGEEVKFSISDGNAPWVMRAVADLYSNRELAVIREYSTNARDAMIEAGKADQPIKVSLPSAMNPYFSVQDFGVGMSETELKEVYTQFGESTKRDSDDFNGMLGFGSKSAIAYTNTFTITSIKNGRKTVAVIVRREDAMGGYLVTLKIVLSTETTEGNGVTVQVPVHNAREFEQKAVDFYRFWKPGTVLVNNKQPVWAVGDKIADNLYMYPHSGTSYVVMGNVAYRINNPDALFPKGMNKISFVAYVENGAVEFTPSREDLKYSDHTKNALHKIIGDFVNTAVSTAKKEIAAAPTHAEAFKAWSRWRSIVGTSQVEDLTFKGDTLHDEFKIDGTRVDTNYSRYNTYHIDGWQVSKCHTTIFVTEFAVQNLASAHKKKAKDWAALKTLHAQYIIFTDSTVKSPWVDPARIVTWEQLKADLPKPVKKPRVTNVAWGRKAGSFDLISAVGREDEQDVPHTKELFYVMVKEFNEAKGRGAHLRNVLKQFKIDHKVVLLPQNRKDKFLRFYPHAKPIMPHLESLVKLDGPSLIKPDDLQRLSVDGTEASILEGMDANKVDDPEIKKWILLHKRSRDEILEEYNRNYQLASLLGMGNQFKRHKYNNYWDCKNTPLTNLYPLASAWRSYKVAATAREQIYIYMNAVYAARKAGKNV